MIRYYGDPPYRAAVIHGGPGAPGSAAGLAAMAGGDMRGLRANAVREIHSGADI